MSLRFEAVFPLALSFALLAGCSFDTAQQISVVRPSSMLKPHLDPFDPHPGETFRVAGRGSELALSDATISIMAQSSKQFPIPPEIPVLEKRIVKITAPDMFLSEEFTAPDRVGSYDVVVEVGKGAAVLNLSVK